MEGEDWCRRQCDKCRKVLPEGWDYAMCRECGEEPCKHGNQVVLFYSKENERLRQLVEEAFKVVFGDGVTAGHPMGSRSSDSEAWENSNSKSEVNNE